MFFQWDQLKHFPTKWKTLTANYSDSDKTRNICVKIIMLVQELEFCLPTNYPLRKFWLYSILISSIVNKPTSNIFFQKLFENPILDWGKIYLLLCLATIDTTLRFFQYNILNNVPFLNKKQYNFGITNTALCSFCNTFEETPIHIFSDCIHVKSLREKLQTKFRIILFCHHLHPRLPFLDWLTTFVTF